MHMLTVRGRHEAELGLARNARVLALCVGAEQVRLEIALHIGGCLNAANAECRGR